jgi:hypothetical protein
MLFHCTVRYTVEAVVDAVDHQDALAYLQRQGLDYVLDAVDHRGVRAGQTVVSAEPLVQPGPWCEEIPDQTDARYQQLDLQEDQGLDLLHRTCGEILARAEQPSKTGQVPLPLED